MTKAQSKASMKYKKENIKRVELNFNKKTEQDLIDYVESQNNVQGEIKRLIRARVNHNIFNNKQINLIRMLIDLRVNDMTDLLEDLNDEIERLSQRSELEQINKQRDIAVAQDKQIKKKYLKEIEELRELRSYIDKIYKGE